MKLGIIGYGNIGRIVAQAIHEEQAGDTTLAAVLDVYETAPFTGDAHAPPYYRDLASFLAADLDLVVETASQSVLKQVAYTILDHNLDLIALSIGALVDHPFYIQLHELARQRGRHVYIPSGAIGGLDALSAAAAGVRRGRGSVRGAPDDPLHQLRDHQRRHGCVLRRVRPVPGVRRRAHRG